MADTIREQIIAAFATRCESLSSNPVDRCRRSMPSSKEPFVSVWDGPDNVSIQRPGAHTHSMQIGVEAAWQTVDNPSIEANAIIGLVEQTVLDADRTFGGLALKTVLQSSQPGYPTDGSSIVTVQMTFLIEYLTPIGDPYSSI